MPWRCGKSDQDELTSQVHGGETAGKINYTACFITAYSAKEAIYLRPHQREVTAISIDRLANSVKRSYAAAKRQI